MSDFISASRAREIDNIRKQVQFEWGTLDFQTKVQRIKNTIHLLYIPQFLNIVKRKQDGTEIPIGKMIKEIDFSQIQDLKLDDIIEQLHAKIVQLAFLQEENLYFLALERTQRNEIEVQLRLERNRDNIQYISTMAQKANQWKQQAIHCAKMFSLELKMLIVAVPMWYQYYQELKEVYNLAMKGIIDLNPVSVEDFTKHTSEIIDLTCDEVIEPSPKEEKKKELEEPIPLIDYTTIEECEFEIYGAEDIPSFHLKECARCFYRCK